MNLDTGAAIHAFPTSSSQPTGLLERTELRIPRVVPSSQPTRIQRVERIIADYNRQQAEGRRVEYMPSGLPSWASHRLAVEYGLAEPVGPDLTDTWDDDEQMTAAEAATDSP